MEEKTQNKKRVLYYSILAACALLLIVGIVLTVYFVTRRTESIAENPPVVQPSDDEPQDPPVSGGEEEPSEPSGGEEAVRFVTPLDFEDYSVMYEDIYHNGTTGWWYRHRAVDFAAPAGTEVRCMADGTVSSVSVSEELGNLIVVDHGDGLKTLYRFVEPDASLKEGATVKKGEKLGVVAEAYGIERKDGEHLHLEVVLGDDLVDPADYLEPVLNEK